MYINIFINAYKISNKHTCTNNILLNIHVYLKLLKRYIVIYRLLYDDKFVYFKNSFVVKIHKNTKLSRQQLFAYVFA
jgi:hypothetical protein